MILEACYHVPEKVLKAINPKWQPTESSFSIKDTEKGQRQERTGNAP